MKEIKILIFINILCVASMMAFLSIVGPIIRALKLQEWHIGLTVAIGGILWVLLSRYWGRKSDIVGRKPVLLIGILGLSISYLILAIFVDYALETIPSVIISLSILILTRGSIGGFYAAITPASNALIADHVEIEKRTSYIAKLGASSGIGMILGPSIGGLLSNYGLDVPLYVFALLPFFSAIIIYLLLPYEKPVTTEKTPILKLFDKRLRVPMIASFLTMFSIVTSQVCLGFFIIDVIKEDLITSAITTGYILSAIGIAFIIAQIFVTKLKISTSNLLILGSIIGTIGFGLVPFSFSKITIAIAFCVATFGMGLIFPAFQTLAVNLVNKNEEGASSGTVNAAQGMGIIIAPLISTMLYKFAPATPFIVNALAFLILLFVCITYKKSITT